MSTVMQHVKTKSKIGFLKFKIVGLNKQETDFIYLLFIYFKLQNVKHLIIVV